MAVSRGKKFEQFVRVAFEQVEGVTVDRVNDQTTHYKGSTNICDFIVYKCPCLYYIECKTVQGNTLPFTNITDTQWQGLLDKSKIPGVIAGVLCWWVDKDVTRFIPIQVLNVRKITGSKSIRYDSKEWMVTEIQGKKKRVFFDYDFSQFFEEAERRNKVYECIR